MLIRQVEPLGEKATSAGNTNGSVKSPVRQTISLDDRDVSHTFQLEMTLKEYTERARQFTLRRFIPFLHHATLASHIGKIK